MSDPVVIVGMARTPMGAFQGAFSTVQASTLGAVAIKAAMEEAGVKAEKVEQTLMGCVLPAGQGQAPARQAAIKAPKARGGMRMGDQTVVDSMMYDGLTDAYQGNAMGVFARNINSRESSKMLTRLNLCAGPKPRKKAVTLIAS